MITDALLSVLFWPLELAIGALPQGDALDLTGNAVIIGFAQFNAFLPLTEAVAAFGVILGVELAIITFRGVITLWQQLPFT
jgi:hypothetical protein